MTLQTSPVASASARPARTSQLVRRPARPRNPDAAAYEALDHTHRAAQVMLQAFARLLAHLDEQGLDLEAEQAATEVLAFFDGPAAQHHRDEERLVFPGLLSGGDAELVQHVERLQQDHGWIEEDWRVLRPQLEAIAAGYNWHDLAMLREAVPVFTALYQEHIALEEQVVYPAARRLRGAVGD
jgi:hemerythrin-like domain-containing protein